MPFSNNTSTGTMICHLRKNYILSLTFILWMLFKKLTSANSESAKFLAKLEVAVSSIPAGHSMIAEENKSVISCGLKCLEDDYCVGFGFIRKPGTKCLVVINRFIQSQIPQDLDGYTYYSKDNKGEDKFRVLTKKNIFLVFAQKNQI